jgi:hypothetical protein
MTRNGRFSWLEALIVLGFAVSVALVAVFLVRSVHYAARLHTQEPIQPWMSVPYVARVYRVSPSVLYQALKLSPRPHDRRPLAAIARAQHRSVQAVIADLEGAIQQARPSPSQSPPDAAPYAPHPARSAL